MLSAYAQSDVYLCVDANGNREYKNTGITKGCKKVDLPGVTTIPTQMPKKAQTASKPASSPADFPRVDDAVQKARDSDRKQILQEELKSEEKKLADLRAEYNNGEPERRGDERNYAKYQERTATLKDNIARSEKNVEALKRELANLK
jgi:predicted RNase H-like nuclease (RuvC/YqgF family)